MSDKIAVWVDSDSCTGSGECVKACSSVFVLGDDNLVRVKRGDELLSGPAEPVEVADEHKDAVLGAVSACPAECIFIEIA